MNLRQRLDQKAIRLVKELKTTETEIIETLPEMRRLRPYEDFHFPSLFAYCVERLGLSEDRAYTYLKIAEVATQVPALKKALDNNELTVTHAKKLLTVITPENQT